jgi:hypothetical protein
MLVGSKKLVVSLLGRGGGDILIKELSTRQMAATAFVGAGIWVVFLLFDPATKFFLPPCPFHLLTGFYCPICGATRALHQLALGNFAAALHLNALAVSGLFLSGLFALWRRPGPMSSWCSRILILAVVLFGMVRNIPVFPFTLLVP